MSSLSEWKSKWTIRTPFRQSIVLQHELTWNPLSFYPFSLTEQKIVALAFIASAAAFSPAPAFRATTALNVDPNPAPKSAEEQLEMGWSSGGQAHTKDPTPQQNDDPRKTIPQGESFEEYMKSRAAGN